MSSSDIALRVTGLGKQYRLGESSGGGTFYRYKSLGETLGNLARNPVKTLTAGRGPLTEANSFWALQDVDFEVKKGEVVGIIGRNGAGKSTLLKILSRITKPTTGRIDLYGRVGSLLEVGTGFHPELSGRENIYLNGAILGMTRAEVKSKFDEIVAFSEIEKFLDTPVKQYSSGMYTRLAFAVAAHLEPEILVVDEVLAVGDAAFQQKCLGKMKSVAGEGRTVLFVSHNAAAVRELCSTALLLKGGKSHKFPAVADALEDYLNGRGVTRKEHKASAHGLKVDSAGFDVPSSNRALTDRILFSSDFSLRINICSTGQPFKAHLVVQIFDEAGHHVASACSLEEGLSHIEFSGLTGVTFSGPSFILIPGRYRTRVCVTIPNDPRLYLDEPDALEFEVLPACVNGSAWSYNTSHGKCRLASGVRFHERLDHPSNV